MAGEIIKSEAVCLSLHPWSRTSQIVTWLTPSGLVSTIARGATRPKSWLLGHFDLNYTCEILYYAKAHGGLHALRECSPLKRRDALRSNWRALATADYLRHLFKDFSPSGPESLPWYTLLNHTLDALATKSPLLATLLACELHILTLAGLAPDFSGCLPPRAPFYVDTGSFRVPGNRSLSLTPETAQCLCNPLREKNLKILLDAARVISVFYTFHLDCSPEVRRAVVRMIS